MPAPRLQQRFFVRPENSNGLPGEQATFEVAERVEKDGAESIQIAYGGFLRKVIADGVAGMLNANPEMSWSDIQKAFSDERKLCI